MEAVLGERRRREEKASELDGGTDSSREKEELRGVGLLLRPSCCIRIQCDVGTR